MEYVCERSIDPQKRWKEKLKNSYAESWPRKNDEREILTHKAKSWYFTFFLSFLCEVMNVMFLHEEGSKIISDWVFSEGNEARNSPFLSDQSAFLRKKITPNWICELAYFLSPPHFMRSNKLLLRIKRIEATWARRNHK